MGHCSRLLGLWGRWLSHDGQEAKESSSIITTDANELMKPMHNRMPVILKSQDYEYWLARGDHFYSPVGLLRPYDSDQMKAWKANPDMANVRNNKPELVDPSLAKTNGWLKYSG